MAVSGLLALAGARRRAYHQLTLKPNPQLLSDPCISPGILGYASKCLEGLFPEVRLQDPG
jgi:hypothetical protein